MNQSIPALALMLFGVLQIVQASVVIDLDASTPAHENNITISVNTQLTVAALETANVVPARDRVGLDLYYQRTTDTATAVPQTVALDASSAPSLTKAGPLASLGGAGTSADLFLGANVSSGTGLRAGSVPLLPGYVHSIGGVGYTANPSIQDFPNTFPIELMSWNLLFPTVGDVHVEVCGILDGAANGAVTTVVPANPYHEIDFNTAFPGPCFPAVVHVVGVPEPSAFWMVGLMALGIVCRIWFLNHKAR